MKECDTPISPDSYPAMAKYALLLMGLVAILPFAKAQQNLVIDSSAIIKSSANPQQTIRQLNLPAVHFTKEPDNRPDLGIDNNQYLYFLLKLSAKDTATGFYLSIDNTSLDAIGIYKIKDRTGKLVYQGGCLMPFKKNNKYVWHTTPVDVGKNPAFYLIALIAAQKNINVRYEIISSDTLQRNYEFYERIVLFYTGSVCMIIAIIVLSFILFRKEVFLVYLGYIVCFFCWMLLHYGRLFPWLYPNVPIINQIAKPVSSLGAAFFLLLSLYFVFRPNLQFSKGLRRLVKGTLYALLVIGGSMLLLLLPGLSALIKIVLTTAWHIGLIFTMCLIVLIPLHFYYNGTTAKIFSCAVIVICVMAVVQLFANSGYINNFFINEHGMAMASLLEMTVMAFGLFYSLQEEISQKKKQVLVLENEQTETLKKLISVQDDERKRIAGDLHDNIGPLLAALKINFRRIIHLREEELQHGLVDKTEVIIDNAIAEIRNVAHNLMPKGLSSNGLINTLNEYFDSLQQLYSKTIFFDHQIGAVLNPQLQTNLYRIICELVLNAARHSKAALINVNIYTKGQQVFVSIYDNGQGFRQKPADQKQTLGLQSAESRVMYMKGKFNLNSEIDKGTQIAIEIPLQFHEAHGDGL